MGREIRRVPPGWQHPKDENDHYIPLLDHSYREAAEEWERDCVLWSRGTHPDQVAGRSAGVDRPRFFWDWSSGPPDEANYRPDWSEEPTWFQAYETVSEGTPITPPFATEAELVDYLVEYGDGWDRPVSRRAAEAFVKSGWAPSMVFHGGALVTGVEALLVGKDAP